MPAALPNRIKLLAWGKNESTEGAVLVNDQTVAAFAAMQRRIGRERAPLDYEHSTVPGTPEYERTREPREIAAMGTPVVITGEGVFLENLSYTASGEANARNYEDVSAAPLLNKDRVVVGLHSAALTRAGAVYGAHFAADEVVKLAGDGVTLAAFSSKLSAALNAADAPKQKTMPDESIYAKFNDTLAAALAPLTARLDKLEAIKPPDVEAAIKPLTARLDALEKSGADAATAAVDAERARLVPLFAREGKAPMNPATGTAYTAEELKALDVPTLKALHANTPVTVPLSARQPVKEGEQKTNLTGVARVAAAWSDLQK